MIEYAQYQQPAQPHLHGYSPAHIQEGPRFTNPWTTTTIHSGLEGGYSPPNYATPHGYFQTAGGVHGGPPPTVPSQSQHNRMGYNPYPISQGGMYYGMAGISPQAAAMAATAAASGQGYQYQPYPSLRQTKGPSPTVPSQSQHRRMSWYQPSPVSINKVGTFADGDVGKVGEAVMKNPHSKNDSSTALWGLKVIIKGRKDTAVSDTSAGQNVISDRRRQALGLEMRASSTSLAINSERIYSPGTVKIPIAFEDDPTNFMIIVAHVVHDFAHDLLLGEPFLRATNCLTKYAHRFIKPVISQKANVADTRKSATAMLMPVEEQRNKTDQTHFKPQLSTKTGRHSQESSSPAFVVRQKGLKVLIKGRKDSAFGDTGAGQNVISERRREELGLELSSDPKSFSMGNAKKIFSPGTVKVPIAFEDDPTNIMTIVAHVVHTFAYDLLLGNPFLKATNCLTKYIHRFVPCWFSFKSKYAFNLLGETTNRFRGQLGNGIDILALPDIGSVRNVMNADWAIKRAKAGGFEILSRRENCGWIVLPDGTEEATVGQVRTTMTLPDGKIVPMVFELLPNCYVPVVLGQDFVFDEHIYTKYSDALCEFSGHDLGDELMPMGYRRNRSEKKKIGQVAALQNVGETDDLERQLSWNIRYHHGRTASSEEWDQENSRREEYQRQRDSHWQPGLSLIQYKPRGHDQQQPAPGNASSNSNASEGGTLGGSVSSSSNTLITPRSPGDSSPSHESPVEETGHSPLDSSLANGAGGAWDSLSIGDFGRDEAAQWQEELLT
ncbi:hypothetical protein N431DRAFT_426094 [Stipitochalara longipes BDJ]|nr:hypothetical protein N431DRAFT_426094 [Stipitochalara longipes BDJ]